MKSNVNKEEIIKYIDKELKNNNIINKDREWLEIIRQCYKEDDVKKVAEKYNKIIQTVYRRKKKLEKTFLNGENINDNRVGNNNLTIQQKNEVIEILNRSPQEVGLVSNIWTGSMLNYYIEYKYNILMSIRSCQRIIADNLYDEDKIKTNFNKVIEDYKKNNKDIWYIRYFSIWKRKEENKSKSKIKSKKPEIEGVFMAINIRNGEKYYRPYYYKTSKAYEECINDFWGKRLGNESLLIMMKTILNKDMADYVNSSNLINKDFSNMKILFKVDKLEIEDKIERLINELKQIGAESSAVCRFSEYKRKRIREIINSFKF